MSHKQPKVLVFPRNANPYQELLYAPMRAKGIPVAYLDGPTPSRTLNLFLMPSMLLYKRLCGYNILHIHWTFLFSLPWAKRCGRLPMQWLAAWCWRKAHLCGYRLVWTAHNVLPHEQQFFNDEKAHRFLAEEADAVIVHNSAGREQLAEIGVKHAAIKTIPHGSYIGVYPDTVSRYEAREQLHLPHDSTVLLCFGVIRPSKGIEQLLAAYQQLAATDKKQITLLVAGEPINQQLVRLLRHAQRQSNKGIRLMLKHIPDEEVQLYFRAADFAVLPYQCSTTSGVALLSFTFGCPIIAPNITAFSDLPNAAQLLFDEGHLLTALHDAARVSRARRDRMGRAAQEYAAALSWNKIAARTARLFNELLA